MLAGAVTGILALTALLAATGAASAGIRPATTNTGPVFGIYGKCVDVRHANPANGTPVQIYTCNGGAAQRWTVTLSGLGGYTLSAVGKCLDVVGAGTANGTRLQIYTCNGGPAQDWVPLNGELINPNSGRCLDDPHSSSANGTRLQIWDCHQGANQNWALP